MEMASIGILIGGMVATIAFAVGVICESERSNSKQHNADNDIRVYVPHRDRSGSSNNRHFEQMDPEEVICGLENINLALAGKEKDFLSYALESVRIRDRLENYIKENES